MKAGLQNPGHMCSFKTKTKPDMTAHTEKPSTKEDEARGSLKDSLVYTAKPDFKKQQANQPTHPMSLRDREEFSTG